MRALVLTVLLSASAALAGEGRAHINLPDDCAFIATAEGAPTPPEVRCAEFLRVLQAAFEVSAFHEGCADWPSLEAASLGEKVEGLHFHALARGRFLVQVRCSSGAYNEASLFFFWDELGEPTSSPPVLVFPVHDGTGTPVVFARDFDAKKRLLWAFRKELGDGSAGAFHLFGFEGEVPVLHESITKSGADYKNGWNFSRTSRPRGPGWVKKTTKVKGCLATLREPRCP